jgi:YVTN family beta-propeller protein
VGRRAAVARRQDRPGLRVAAAQGVDERLPESRRSDRDPRARLPLRIDPEQIDLCVFEQLLENGRRAHAERAYADAAKILREALALWRGPPLADFAFDAFASSEIARLQELRLEALELRIDADLELGRHATLVAELEVLTAEHPLRERLCAQHMLALYRSGRQSEALGRYTEARAALVDELGLEPGLALRDLQQAMLRQDPALEPVPEPEAPPATNRNEVAAHRRRPLVPVIAGAAIAAAAATLIALLVHGAPRVVVQPNSVAYIDPARNAVVGQVAVGVRPADISASADGIWVANRDDNSISQIDAHSAQVVRTMQTGTSVDALTTDGNALWTMDAPDGMALRIDPTFRSVVRRVRVGKRLGASNTAPSPIAAGVNSIWASTGFAAVAHVPGGAGAVTRTDVGNEPAALADGDGATWVVDDLDDTVSRIDRAGVVTKTTPVGDGASALAVGAGAVWVANTADGTVTRIDPATGAGMTTIPVGAGPTGIAVGAGAVWVANSRDGTVSRIDPRRDRVVATIAVGDSPDNLTVSAGRVWVTVQTGSVSPPSRAGGTVRIVQGKDFNSTDPALMVGYGPQAAQLEFATCAKLLNYPDLAGPRGSRLVPEVAAAMPRVSADGRTYTFIVRRSFRFSPPSNELVTARAFARAIERFLSPTLQPQDDLAVFLSDIVGYDAYRSRRTAHLAGVSATSRTLTIRLAHPDPSLPTRMAMPYLCAVPPDTPIRAGAWKRSRRPVRTTSPSTTPIGSFCSDATPTIAGHGRTVRRRSTTASGWRRKRPRRMCGRDKPTMRMPRSATSTSPAPSALPSGRCSFACTGRTAPRPVRDTSATSSTARSRCSTCCSTRDARCLPARACAGQSTSRWIAVNWLEPPGPTSPDCPPTNTCRPACRGSATQTSTRSAGRTSLAPEALPAQATGAP